MRCILNILNKNIIITLLVGSILFLVGVNKFLSPIIFIFLIAFPIFLYRLCIFGKIYSIEIYFILYIFCVTCILTLQKYFLYHKYGFSNELFRHLFWVFYGLLFFEFARNIKNKLDFYTIVRYFVNISLVVFIFELLFRLFFAILSGITSFYSFKFNSILYPDSNFTGISLLLIYIFINNFPKAFKNIHYYNYILIFLIIFCFSRTVYFLFLVYFLFNIIFSRKKYIKNWIYKCVIVFFVLFFSLFVGSSLYDYVEEDGSFNTKFEIFDGFVYILNNEDYSYIYGIGSGNLFDYINRESHNIWGLTAEMGFFWLVIFLIFFIRLLFEKKFFWLTVVLLVSGFTAILPITYMTLYICLFVLTYLYNRLED